jgi:transcriptional regulator with XRE-family HTH domain
MVTARQTRAARAWLGWTQDDLARASTVAKRTIAEFELGNRVPYDRTLRDIRDAFERAGVGFLFEDKVGVGLTGPTVDVDPMPPET